MCVGDYRLNRLVRWVRTNRSVAAGGEQILPPDQQRVAVAFFNSTTDIHFSFGSAAVSGISPLADDRYSGNVLITLQQHGDLPSKAWFAEPDVGASSIEIWEAFLPERFLSIEGTELERLLSQ